LKPVILDNCLYYSKDSFLGLDFLSLDNDYLLKHDVMTKETAKQLLKTGEYFYTVGSNLRSTVFHKCWLVNMTDDKIGNDTTSNCLCCKRCEAAYRIRSIYKPMFWKIWDFAVTKLIRKR